jgi:uncharacterized repeat protein (TIGR03803 family)
MEIPLVRSAHTVWQRSQPHIINRGTATSTFAFLFILALLLATPLKSAYSGSSYNSSIYSFGTTMPTDGAVPKGSLTYANGFLFGRTTTVTSTVHHQHARGVIFHFNPSNVATTYRIDHMFMGHPDGENPRHDAMTPFNNLLYGTTLEGGTHNNGLIFSIDPTSFDYTPLTSLHNAIGDSPHSCFVVVNNVLYGMTAAGGENDEGVIFSLDPSTSNYQLLYSFTCNAAGVGMGGEPHGRLTLDPNGTTLYGMTRKGGHNGLGVVFSVDTSGNNYTILHDFTGGSCDGATSDHGYLVQVGNVLYGMTTNGGLSSNGVLFSIGTDGSNFQLLHRFGITRHDGENPYGSLFLDGNQLYGTTANGGSNGSGTVFVINTDGTGYARLHSFGSTHHEGTKPIDNVILVNGMLYGMTTEGGTFGQGTVFAVPSNSIETYPDDLRTPAPCGTPTPTPTPIAAAPASGTAMQHRVRKGL